MQVWWKRWPVMAAEIVRLSCFATWSVSANGRLTDEALDAVPARHPAILAGATGTVRPAGTSCQGGAFTDSPPILRELLGEKGKDSTALIKG